MLNLTPEQIAALKTLPLFDMGDVQKIQKYFGDDRTVIKLAEPVKVKTNGVLATSMDASVRPLAGTTLLVEGVILNPGNTPEFIFIPDPDGQGHRILGFVTLEAEYQAGLPIA
ncbi:hypothetical protein KJ840_03840 [Patescibacteria group bacterium]|nr:hypothetical protein [Patescibacteria group bacterium]